MARIPAVCFCLVLGCSLGVSQVTGSVSSTTTTSDPQAIAYARQAVLALVGTTNLADIMLSGAAIQTAGATVQSGPATFKAKGLSESRTDFSASGLSEIRTLDSSGNPVGVWITPDGVSHAMAAHNVWTDAAWFFPALSYLAVASQPNIVAQYIGQETKNGQAVQHLRFWRVPSSAASIFGQVFTGLSTEDVYLDAATFLPAAITFNTHANSDLNTDIPAEIDYTNYQQVSGVMVPFHVQRLLANSVIVDFQVNQAAINTGLTDSSFSLQQ